MNVTRGNGRRRGRRRRFPRPGVKALHLRRGSEGVLRNAVDVVIGRYGVVLVYTTVVPDRKRRMVKREVVKVKVLGPVFHHIDG